MRRKLHLSLFLRMAKMIQLRSVPDALHRRLRSRATRAGMHGGAVRIQHGRKAVAPAPGCGQQNGQMPV